MNDETLELWMNIKLHGKILDQEVLEENDVACFVRRAYRYENDIYEAFVKNEKMVILKKNGVLFDWDYKEVEFRIEAVERGELNE